MKVVAFNGSPRKEGNTYHAIKIVAEVLEKKGIDVEIVHVGNKTLQGCLACHGCARNRDEKCVTPGDEVNEWIGKMKEADGIIFGSPVHFSSIGATMKAFLDRACFVASVNESMLRHKVAASVVAVRRSGGVTTFEQLNNYITYSEMVMATSNYWNVIHGMKPGEVLQDEEGLQILRLLGENMAWLLQLIEKGEGVVERPEKVKKTLTNFIR
ncbi:flavodoxin family protein [Heliorestis convoluta]|uniref:NADPH-dependent FMN reductase n=1 Tax=Heliorestis convoluta TaxID=356322 RepID=A0A5Q2MYR0_9FIRM|nr:flavodoxin family protein [Heliorestis convoluta]QGG48084.1 NADPH-dependent FMN reductase [Heliorestis convoluta]